MKKIFKFGLFSLSAVLLTACGGGGGGGGSTPVNTAEGLWQGPSTTGATVTVAVLENGESWGGATVGNTLVSALAGNASGNGTSFSASGSEFYFTSNTVGTGTLSGTVTQKQRIQATSSTGGSVNLAYNSYYDQAVTAADVAGSYTLSGRSASYSIPAMTFTISSTGSFTIVQTGCTTTGTATPRASGKAIVNVTATGTGPSCALSSGVSMSGIAVLDKSVMPNALFFMALNSAKTDGLVLLGRKN